METRSKFITIPNIIVNDAELSINAKYLYGWIQNEIYFGDFNKSMNDIVELLNCSISTARKNLKELKEKNYIKIEIINGNQRKITPLISDSMILNEYSRIQNRVEKEEKQKKIELGIIKEQPDFVKEFINNMK